MLPFSPPMSPSYSKHSRRLGQGGRRSGLWQENPVPARKSQRRDHPVKDATGLRGKMRAEFCALSGWLRRISFVLTLLLAAAFPAGALFVSPSVNAESANSLPGALRTITTAREAHNLTRAASEAVRPA